MAMDIKFLRGLAANYAAIATKDDKTFYYTTDDKKLYLGNICLSNQPVEERLKVIEDHGYLNAGEVDGKISAAIANYYTKNEIDAKIAGLSVSTITQRVETLEGKVEAIEADYLKAADKEALQAEIDADVKVVTDYIANNEAKWSEKYDDTALAARVDAVEKVADAAQTAQEVSDAIEAKVTALKLGETYEPIGAEQRAKDYSDDKLTAVVEQYLTGEGAADTIDTLNEIVTWINSDSAGASQIIKDVAANTANISTVSGDLDKVELQLNGIPAGDGTVKAAIDAVDAKFANYTKTADLGDLATKDNLTAGEVGAYTKEEVNSAIATATTDMATKTFVANTYVAKEGYFAYSKADQDRIVAIEAKPAMNILATDINAWNAEKGAKELAGQKATLDDVKNAYIGSTKTKLADVVKAVNMLAEGTEATDKVVETVATNVKDIETQLTWGSF